MKKKRKNININFPALLTIAFLLLLWQAASSWQLIPAFMLPAPLQVVQAFIADFSLLMFHSKVTLLEALLGLVIGVLAGVLSAILMDRFPILEKALHPLLVLTQTVPTVAIAPLLTVWFGFGMTPKIVLIVITIFFPVTVSMLKGFRSVDPDEIKLLTSMGANPLQMLWFLKLPASLNDFFAALKIAATYAVVGAVVSEWLGGFEGLGVYMTRVRKSYAFDKMFAVIFLISIISLLLVTAINFLEKIMMPWKEEKKLGGLK
ncbi:ABC-type nitrate/sulfonate/bicarbonate transport system permease component [Enterococcus sp. PF1-24]|uniref:ABC transporter permease n=1 Tax=unclassified Enterococcus TaxID=2608891 RepID=UPI002476A456|nr:MULTISPECIES: ABC transporter permease [unclassified Enterococcus]MDH6365574.1 ABC-type nitrate/sulfonate/bicarbonate transport system permease component [Enterococcus sp. PFB1-1]MDH6402676.1 ABC-type nitrate/sulfonate/bicarbonate transport system permease component [Enterococcus sp. PF1-24]